MMDRRSRVPPDFILHEMPGGKCHCRAGGCVAITGERVFCHFDRREKSLIYATFKTKISRLRLEMTLRNSLAGGNPEFLSSG